jgi:hypothetical protein
LENCILLCSNCHREIHSRDEWKTWHSPESSVLYTMIEGKSLLCSDEAYHTYSINYLTKPSFTGTI